MNEGNGKETEIKRSEGEEEEEEIPCTKVQTSDHSLYPHQVNRKWIINEQFKNLRNKNARTITSKIMSMNYQYKVKFPWWLKEM